MPPKITGDPMGNPMGGSVDMPPMDPNQNQPNPDPNQNSMAQNPAAPVIAHHAMLGSAVKRIAESLEGQNTTYAPDPITGEVKEVPVQRKPGQFFRDLILGAAMGGAASAQTKPMGWAGGLSTGMAAQVQNQKQQQQQQKEEAFGQAQRAKAERDKQQAKQEAQAKTDALNQQTVAAHTHSILAHTINGDHYSPDQMDTFSRGNQTLLQKAGGRAVGVELNGPGGKNLNGTTGNGKKLAEMVQKDPSLMRSPDPDTFHRMDFMTYDKSAMAKDGVKYQGDRWVGKDGQPVDMDNYAIHDIRDVPNTLFGEQMDMKNSEWNAVAGQKIMSGNDDSISHGTFGQAVSLNVRANSKANGDLAERHRPYTKEEALQAVELYKQMKANPKDYDQDEQDDINNKYQKAQIALKVRSDQDITDDQRKLGDKRQAFPELKQPEDAVGFANQAAENLKNNPEADTNQKAIWQEQVQYGQKMAKTLTTSIANTAAVKTGAEERARDAQHIDPSMSGAAGLVPADKERFANLPVNIQRQMNEVRSSQIASIFQLADGDESDTTFTQNPRKGTGSISRDQATGLAHDMNPYWTPTLFRDKQKLRADYLDTAPTKVGGKLVAFDNLMQHANDLADVAQEWKDKRTGTGVPLISMSLKDIRKNLKGDPLLTKLEAAISAPTKEYMNVLNQGHAEQQIDRQTMNRIFDEDSTPQQIATAMQSVIGIATDQLDSYDQPWRTLTGGSYPNLISPRAKIAAGKFGFANKVAQYGSGGRLTRASMNQTPQPNQNALTNVGTHAGEKIGWDGKNWVNAQTRQPAKGWNGTAWEKQ